MTKHTCRDCGGILEEPAKARQDMSDMQFMMCQIQKYQCAKCGVFTSLSVEDVRDMQGDSDDE